MVAVREEEQKEKQRLIKEKNWTLQTQSKLYDFIGFVISS